MSLTLDPVVSPPSPAPAARLLEFARQVENGVRIDLADLARFAERQSGQLRGAARRLLAHALLRQSQFDALQLLTGACRDLEFADDTCVRQVYDLASQLHVSEELCEFYLEGAHSRLRASVLPTALSYLTNAAALDLRNGARRVNDPKALPRFIDLYTRAAAAGQKALRVQPAPRAQRRSPNDGPYRLAHVICQLVDKTHAPSRSIRTVLMHSDRQRFEIYLVITEALAPHTEHVGQTFFSDLSERRAPALMAELREQYGVKIIQPTDRRSCLTAAAELHRRLAEERIDLAFFHGSLATPTDWLLCAWRAAPWQIDFGYGVPLHNPMVDFQLFEFEHTMEALAFQCRELGIPYAFGGGGHDASDIEAAVPISRSELNIPADHVILGVLGNHLVSRMSAEYCETVARVLRERPKATLLVVGPGDFSGQAKLFGPDLAGGDCPRVRFLGPTREPHRFTKTFDIFVNQYPAGGGFAVGDAMAASKPVVCMRLEDSNYALSSLGWVGDDNAVDPPTDDAYAARLRQLIDQPEERARFGQTLRSRYESVFDGRVWARQLCDHAWNVIHQPTPTTSLQELAERRGNRGVS